MKKILFIAIYIVFCSSVFSQGFIHRDNKKIVTGSGEEIILRGMGLGGWMLQEGYMMRSSAFAGTQHDLKSKLSELIGEDNMNEFYDAWLKNHCTSSDIDSLAKWGFNSVRLPMHYNLFTLPVEKEPVAGQNTWLDKGFNMVDSLLKWCTANQMYLILDLHAAPGGQGHDAAIADYDDTKPSLWESAANRAKTVELWRKLAEKYADNQWIGGYDLLNEANWDLPGGTMLKQLYVDIIAAIRSVDNNHLIFIEGNWFANDFTGLLPSTTSSPLMDENMAYSFHKYWNSTGTGSIQWMLDIRNNYNVPIWLGESGENSNEWFARTIKTMEGNNIGWAWWPLKKIGSVAGVSTIVETAGYRTLLNYWEKGGTKPTTDFAKSALLEVAEKARIENCIIHHDVIDAMFRQVKHDNHLPYIKLLIPGTIAVTDYNLGKVNSAYMDVDYINDKETSTEWNKGYEYRNDGVDIEKCLDTESSNGYNIGWTDKNEWLNYTVNVEETGFYDVTFRIASNAVGGLFHVELNGKDVTGTVAVPNTGGYQAWNSVAIKNISLEQGTDTLKLVIDKGGFNISSMTWAGPTANTDAPLRLLSAYTNEGGSEILLTFSESLKGSLRLNTSDFEISNGASVAIGNIEQSATNANQIILYLSGNVNYTDVITLSYSGSVITNDAGDVLPAITSHPVINTMLTTQFIPGKVEAESFTENYGLTVEDCTDTGAGKDLGYSDNGDYLEFLVNVNNGGTYNVECRYSTPDDNTKAEIFLFDAGTKTSLGTFEFVKTGGWQNWSSKTISVNLPAGIHRLRYSVVNARFNTNYLKFTQTATSVSNLQADEGFLVYPNPSNGIINIQATSLNDYKYSIQVVDMIGRIYYEQTCTGGNEIKSLDLSGKDKGLYFIHFQTKNSSLVKSLLLN